MQILEITSISLSIMQALRIKIKYRPNKKNHETLSKLVLKYFIVTKSIKNKYFA